MIYRPNTGAMWDPSILWCNGRYHAFMMYSRETANGLEATHCLLAVSDDGVHWRDEAAVIEERERDCKLFKCMVGRCGDRFILNHGVARPEGQDTLRFYESADLCHWTYLFSTRPDPRWYGLPPEASRWDHMYMLPKEEGRHAAGYWGYPVAIARPEAPRGVGLMESPDGRAWEALPPARVEWGAVPAADLEWGGCERFAGRYYLIGGGVHMGYRGYGMFAFLADDPQGPFRPAVGAFRLCGHSDHHVAWLAVWCRGNGELLISNYASAAPGSMAPWLLPLRRPLVDRDGCLRLAWWPGNEALKGQPLALGPESVTLDGRTGHAVVLLDAAFNPERGVVVEGTLRARGAAHGESVRPAAGFALDEGDGTAMVTLMDLGAPGTSQTRIGRLRPCAGEFTVMDTTGRNCATVTGLDDSRPHGFRLLARKGLFEIYLDDRLVQTFFCHPGAGRAGFAASHATAEIAALRAWHMSF